MTVKRLLNWKVIVTVTALLFLVTCYFAARKIMVWDVKLGMSAEQVLVIMGKPTQQYFTSVAGDSMTYLWESYVLNETVYQRKTAIIVHESKGVTRIVNLNVVFGKGFQSAQH